MTVAPGSHLGPYEIVAPLGAGGMGEVYKARDERLGRQVAVKVLPASYAGDPERLRRFEQEARAAGQLNHSNVLAIYDVGTHDGAPYLVSELLEGESLRQVLGGGPLPQRKALEVGAQVARGLAAAHDKGIVHRDLKPENLFLTRDGTVKILDFGLAKLTQPERLEEGETLLDGAPPSTEAGVVLGTVGYMSPEQVRGQAADHRSDLFSLGAILYEMLTGRPAFLKETAADTLSAILREDPPEPEESGRQLPPAADRLVRHCLEKRPEERFQSARDLAFDLESLTGASGSLAALEAPGAGRRLSYRGILPWAVAAGLAAVALLALWTPWRQAAAPWGPVARYTVAIPEGDELLPGNGGLALSPDGGRLVLSVLRDGRVQLLARRRDRLEPEPIPGAEGIQPFFSPDGSWLGFVGGGALRKVSLAGGPPVEICGALDPVGLSWGPDGTIVFSPAWGQGLVKVPAAGGTPEPLTALDHGAGEGAHLWPQVLPGGEWVLFTVWTKARWDEARIAVASLETGEHRAILEGGTHGRYAPSGHLLFVRGGNLMAAPFDPGRLEVTGEAAPLVPGVFTFESTGWAAYAVAGDGTLAYVPGATGDAGQEIAWVDRRGAAAPALEEHRAFQRPRLSPDGRRVAVTVEGGTYHVWLYDLESGSRTRFTPEADSGGAIWTPDGQRLVYWANPEGPYHLYWKPVEGGGPAERLAAAAEGFPQPDSFSPDGGFLLYTLEDVPGTRDDLWLLSMGGDPTPRPFLRTPASELGAAVSPDGGWVAYVSDETGSREVYVTTFPEPGPRWQISGGGGDEPRWNPAGGELFFRQGTKVLRAPVETRPSFRAGKAEVLFDGRFEEHHRGRPNYDISPDGERFLMVRELQEGGPREIAVVLNWFREVRERVPAGGR